MHYLRARTRSLVGSGVGVGVSVGGDEGSKFKVSKPEQTHSSKNHDTGCNIGRCGLEFVC